MIVHVRLFATLRRQYPNLGVGEAMPVELPDGATVEQLVKHLRLPAAEIKVIFVNSVTQQRGHVLDDGDQVGVFPAVGGG